MIEEIRICITQAFIKIFGKNTRISDRQYNQILYRLRTGKKPTWIALRPLTSIYLRERFL